jgi:hypothetical protein
LMSGSCNPRANHRAPRESMSYITSCALCAAKECATGYFWP